MPGSERVREKEVKRQKIMQAAIKVFSRKGYSPAALDEVAKGAGIAKGTLYLYFQDKEDLFYSTIMHVIDNLSLLLQEKLDEKNSPIKILEDLAFYQLQYFSQNRDFFGIFQTVLNDNLLINHKKLFNMLLKKKNDLVDYESKIVERGKTEGLIRKDIETLDIVNSFDGMVETTIKQVGNIEKTNKEFDVNSRIKSIMKIFLEGVSG
ncbi:MAG TPA: TetR/AcrR family transcriptional regulator [Spirochaetes bacterium]|nr:TetR/AcrR family transcriptional regulator [Spirochaetota bacterium]